MSTRRGHTIELTLASDAVAVDAKRLRAAVRTALRQSGIESARVGIVVVDDATIRVLNRRHLDHDYATDVLSFPLERRPGYVEGEIVVSAETALRESARYRWPAADELLLYAVHGALHLAGCDDRTARQAAEMRRRERVVLAEFDLDPPWDDHRSANRREAPVKRRSGKVAVSKSRGGR